MVVEGGDDGGRGVMMVEGVMVIDGGDDGGRG